MVWYFENAQQGRDVPMQERNTTPFDAVIVGGGLTGLTAAAWLARAGRSVLLFEKASQPGGRAITLEREGFFFNRGIHAFYLTGTGEAVLRDLGIAYSGK